ncbi:MAG TPA: hypothetical protein VNO86_00245 [Candidatus Binatia bacterium]|nr:hypothetical protein [Candidatus Binatia bacterium]
MPPRSRRRPARPRSAAPLALVPLLVLLVLLVVACAVETGPPEPTPARFDGIVLALQRHGIAVADVVSGDPGCADTELVAVAVRFEASGLDAATPYRVYLYRFRDRAAFDRLRTRVDACARAYVADPETFASVEAPPFVLVGQGPWPPGLAAALRAGLTEAAGNGG